MVAWDAGLGCGVSFFRRGHSPGQNFDLVAGVWSVEA